MENNSEIKTKKIEFNLSSSFLQELINKIEAKDLFSVNDLLSKLHPSDIAEVISNLPEKNRFELIALENFKINPHVIADSSSPKPFSNKSGRQRPVCMHRRLHSRDGCV